jgi:hypothetical protein
MTLNITSQHLEALSPFFKGKEGVRGQRVEQKYATCKEMVDQHFEFLKIESIPSKKTFSLALSMLEEKPASIVETGSSAWGLDSSTLLDKYVNSFGGCLQTVDIRVEPLFSLPKRCSGATTVFCDDSINFLRRLNQDSTIDFAFLDSFDLDMLDPVPSMIHGLNEFLTILPVLQKNSSILLVDDTPCTIDHWIEAQGNVHLDHIKSFMKIHRIMPGKGALVRDYIERHTSAEIVLHEYQLLVKF